MKNLEIIIISLLGILVVLNLLFFIKLNNCKKNEDFYNTKSNDGTENKTNDTMTSFLGNFGFGTEDKPETELVTQTPTSIQQTIYKPKIETEVENEATIAQQTQY